VHRREGRKERLDVERFLQDPVHDAVRRLGLPSDVRAPAGEEEDRHVRRSGFDLPGDVPPGEARHAEIGDDRVDGGRDEQLEASGATFDVVRKDMSLVRKLGRRSGFRLPINDCTYRYWKRAVDAGMGKEDWSKIVLVLKDFLAK
jgi:hypothetical protein